MEDKNAKLPENENSAAEMMHGEVSTSLKMRREREELIKQGIEFPRITELSYIDDKGNVVVT